MLLLTNLINKSVYGTIGYISSQDDLDLLEQYILYNLPVLKEYKQIVVATNYKNYPEFVKENTQLWKKYFSNCIILDSQTNRGHNFGTADLDNIIFDYCKENNIEWLCKSANDIILQKEILNKEIEEVDFYYLNGIGYGWIKNNPMSYDDYYKCFNPQTNFYFINVDKTDYLNNKKYLDKTYDYIQSISNYNGKIWEYFSGWECEGFLRQCIERNNLLKYHLVSQEKYNILLEIIKNYQIYDSSHKNIMIEGICHYQNNNQPIIEI
jgi:hypothetical protein